MIPDTPMSTPVQPIVPTTPFAESAATRSTLWHRPLALTAMGLLTLALWVIQHPFRGIMHDSVLYSLFALAKLHPDTLTADVFLRFGSQDRFSVFAPIYAAAISRFGLEHAAVLLLLLSQATLFGCAWLLARRFMQPLDATLSLALLVLLPDEYGLGSTFHYLEDFITARIPAEALVVGAVLAAATQRYWIAAGCVIAAMLIHPIMGIVGAAFLILTFLVPRYPKLTLAAAGIGFAATLAIVVAIAPLGRVADKTWLFTIHSTSSYLFMTLWSPSDWSRAAGYLVVLVIGSWVGATPLLRRICLGLLATVACGSVITVVFCDVLHVSLFIDFQAWRWFWLADVLAVTLAPAIIQACWQRGGSGRLAVVTLAGVWVFRDLPPDLLIDAAAIAFAAVPSKWTGHRYWRPLLVAACVLLGVAICLDVINLPDYVPVATTHNSVLLRKVRSVFVDGILPGTVLFAIWVVLRRSIANTAKPQAALAAALPAAIAGVLVCGWLLPFAWENYTTTYYTPELASRFAQWRAEMPPHAEVLWPGNPVGTWDLLDRPSFWSGPQVAGAIFSKEKALVVQGRTTAVGVVLNPPELLARYGQPSEQTFEPQVPVNGPPMNLKGLHRICADPDLQYVVSWLLLAPTPFPPVTIDPSRQNGVVYLYRCADLRS